MTWSKTDLSVADAEVLAQGTQPRGRRLGPTLLPLHHVFKGDANGRGQLHLRLTPRLAQFPNGLLHGPSSCNR